MIINKYRLNLWGNSIITEYASISVPALNAPVEKSVFSGIAFRLLKVFIYTLTDYLNLLM